MEPVMSVAQVSGLMPGGRGEALEALVGDGLGFGVLEDAVGAVAAAEAGVAHAAHGRVDAAPGGGERLVDVDGPGVDAGGDGPAAGTAAGPDAGVEPVGGGVGQGDGLLVVPVGVDGDDGAEGLVGVERHVGRDVGEDRRLVEERAEVGARTASGENRGALGDGVVHVVGDGGELGGGGEAADVHAVVVRAPDGELPGAGDERGDEVVAQGLGDVEAFDGDAELPGGGEAGGDGSGGGLVDVGVVEDDHGVLAAEFEGGADQAAA